MPNDTLELEIFFDDPPPVERRAPQPPRLGGWQTVKPSILVDLEERRFRAQLDRPAVLPPA